MGKFTFPGKNTSVNSLWSIWYCILVLGLQSYITYVAIAHYVHSTSLKWGASNKPPSELTAHVGLICLSLLCVPVFIIASLFRVGNYANDGVKFGRDHLMRLNLDYVSKPARSKWSKIIWRHFCPVSQTIHLIMAFCSLLPTTMTVAMEIKYGYQPTETIWKTDLDFLFPSGRTRLSDQLALNWTDTSNVSPSTVTTTTTANNSLHIVTGPKGWAYHSAVTPAYVNFCAALLAFSVRYPAVYWYTNKVLSCIFAATLLGITLESLFAFSGFSLLYKLSVNRAVYNEVSTVLGPSSALVLYMISGFLLLVSSVAVFEYGFHFFQLKFRVVEQNHHPHVVKQMKIAQNSCHGYIPHFSAMVVLVVLAACKGPIIFDLVQVYRMTGDVFALTCVIVDVCYMLLWIALWFVLTIKQQWRFRILDYMSVGNPVFTIQNDHVVRNPNFEANLELAELKRRKKRRVRASRPLSGELTGSERSDDTETATDEDIDELPDPNLLENLGAEGLERQSASLEGVLVRKNKHRRSLGQRVTFNDDVKMKNLTDDESFEKSTRAARLSNTIDPKQIQLDVTAEVHDASGRQQRRGRENSPSKPKGSPAIITVANPSAADSPPRGSKPDSRDSTMTREYRKNIRSKCDEYYSGRPGSFLNDLEEGSQESLAGSGSVISNRLDSPRTPLDSPRTPPEGGTPVKISPTINIESAINNKYEERRLSHENSPLKDLPKRNSLHLDKRRSGSYNDNVISLQDLKDMKSSALRNSSGSLRNSQDMKPDLLPMDTNHLMPRPIKLINGSKPDIGRRDSANYSMASSQETSSNDSDHGLCSQV